MPTTIAFRFSPCLLIAAVLPAESFTVIKYNQTEQWSPLELFSSDSSANVSDVVDVSSGTEKHPNGGKDNTKKKEMAKEKRKKERQEAKKEAKNEARKEAKNVEKYKREAGQDKRLAKKKEKQVDEEDTYVEEALPEVWRKAATTKGGCPLFCTSSKREWTEKCDWTSKACVACDECSKLAKADDKENAGDLSTWGADQLGSTWGTAGKEQLSKLGEIKDNCDAACFHTRKSWNDKCGWKNCNGCNECDLSQPGVVLDECQATCFQVKQHGWDDKCVWVSCKGCHECNTNTAGIVKDGCDNTCMANNGKSWDDKCTLSTCKGCNECNRDLPDVVKDGCDSSCSLTKGRDWGDKCRWDACKGCNECNQNKL